MKIWKAIIGPKVRRNRYGYNCTQCHRVISRQILQGESEDGGCEIISFPFYEGLELLPFMTSEKILNKY